MGNLFAQDALTGDEATENWLREMYDMPLKAEGTRPKEADAAKNNPNAADPFGNQKGDTKQQQGKIGGNAGKNPTSAN
jgi:ferritin-like metal-binding protein YciE